MNKVVLDLLEEYTREEFELIEDIKPSVVYHSDNKTRVVGYEFRGINEYGTEMTLTYDTHIKDKRFNLFYAPTHEPCEMDWFYICQIDIRDNMAIQVSSEVTHEELDSYMASIPEAALMRDHCEDYFSLEEIVDENFTYDDKNNLWRYCFSGSDVLGAKSNVAYTQTKSYGVYVVEGSDGIHMVRLEDNTGEIEILCEDQEIA